MVGWYFLRLLFSENLFAKLFTEKFPKTTSFSGNHLLNGSFHTHKKMKTIWKLKVFSNFSLFLLWKHEKRKQRKWKLTLPKVEGPFGPEFWHFYEVGLYSKGKHVAPVQLLVLREHEGLSVPLNSPRCHRILLFLLQWQHEKLRGHLLYALEQIQMNPMVYHLFIPFKQKF